MLIMNKKKVLIIFIVISFLCIFIAALIYFSWYFNRTSVMIDSDYEISNMSVYLDGSSYIDYQMEQPFYEDTFNFYSTYGPYIYKFDLQVYDRTIPVRLKLWKTNAWEHYDYRFVITKGQTSSQVNICIYEDTSIYSNDFSISEDEQYDIYENDTIEISSGP